jgi:hypothetical protein
MKLKKMLEKLGVFSEAYDDTLEKGQLSSTKEEQEAYIEAWETLKEDVGEHKKPSITTFVETNNFAIQPKNLTKFPHYFAEVPNFTHLDIYMVSEMFKLNSYQHHCLKKVIAAGKRGGKDTVKDLQEVIATVEGWIEAIEANKVL